MAGSQDNMCLKSYREGFRPSLTPTNDFNNFFPRVLAPNPYSKHQPPPTTNLSKVHPPPSPPRDTGDKRSLPSISSLLNHQEDEKPGEAKAVPGPDPHKSTAQHAGCITTDVRYDGLNKHTPHHSTVQSRSTFTAMLPPTPPLIPDRDTNRHRSYSNSSQHSFSSRTPFQLGSSLNNMDPFRQRVIPADQLKRYSMPPQPTVSPYLISPYAASSPGGVSVASSFYSPANELRAFYSPYNGRSYPTPNHTPAVETKPSFPLHEQKPLPVDFPPTSLPVSVLPPPHPSPNGSSASNPTEHHHYIGNANQASFQQAQERYACATCKKAFSRPSSLRIHSHSHTGEKPFKCPHSGCGKTFSVRSNMKRHERGCHARPGQLSSTATATATATA